MRSFGRARVALGAISDILLIRWPKSALGVGAVAAARSAEAGRFRGTRKALSELAPLFTITIAIRFVGSSYERPMQKL